jgi:hypothetical protein
MNTSLAEALCAIALAVDRVEQKVDAIMRQERRQGRQMGDIVATLDDVKAKVEAEGTVVASAVTLLGELKTKLDQAIADDDPAALQALSDALGAQTDALSQAVTANTPAQP